MRNTQEAIIFTLHYADCFDQSLTFQEIWKFLPTRISQDILKHNLDVLVKLGEVEAQSGHYFLSGRASLPDLSSQFGEISSAKVSRAKSLSGLISKLPWVHEIGVSGSVASGTAKEGDDIDLVIVTSPNRLWFTRLIIVTYLKFTRQYRGKTIKDKFCPNVWLSLDNLEFEKRSYYLAREIASVKVIYPVRERSVIHDANPWVGEYLPQILDSNLLNGSKEGGGGTTDRATSLRGWGEVSPIPSSSAISYFDWVDSLAFSLQKLLMKRHITKEIVQTNRALFHPVNYQDVLKDKIDAKMHPKYREILVDSKFWP